MRAPWMGNTPTLPRAGASLPRWHAVLYRVFQRGDGGPRRSLLGGWVPRVALDPEERVVAENRGTPGLTYELWPEVPGPADASAPLPGANARS